MHKIPTIFLRDFDGDPSRVLPIPNPDAAWVFAGEGRATVKVDGTACLLRSGKLFRRYDAKKGRTPPENFEPCEPEPDLKTGHWPGWLPVGDGPEDRYHREAFAAMAECAALDPIDQRGDGTWELIGPKIQGNPYGRINHSLVRHGAVTLYGYPLTFDGLADAFAQHSKETAIEGIVWHHPDGRMAKIKRRDFGLPWPA